MQKSLNLVKYTSSYDRFKILHNFSKHVISLKNNILSDPQLTQKGRVVMTTRRSGIYVGVVFCMVCAIVVYVEKIQTFAKIVVYAEKSHTPQLKIT